MKDIKSWFNCRYTKPDKNGTYLLMAGDRHPVCGFMTMSIIKTKWNKKTGWDLKAGLVPVQWKYVTSEDEKKYHLERVNINDYRSAR